jgi:hypothetical protein
VRRLFLLALSALLLSGAGIVSDGDSSELPISPTGGLPVMTPTAPDQMAWAPDDAGMLWLPTPWNDGEAMDAGSRHGSPPTIDAGPPGPCSPIEARIEHRRRFLSEVWIKSTQVEAGVEYQAYCEQHPGEVECERPPTVSERDISEAIDDGTDGGEPEIDAWIIRWQHELARCLADHPLPRLGAAKASSPSTPSNRAAAGGR